MISAKDLLELMDEVALEKDLEAMEKIRRAIISVLDNLRLNLGSSKKDVEILETTYHILDNHFDYYSSVNRAKNKHTKLNNKQEEIKNGKVKR